MFEVKDSSYNVYRYTITDNFATRWLLQHGADPNAKSRLDPFLTPTSLAVLNADMATIELLFHWGADVNKSPLLHLLTQRKDRYTLQIIQFLLDHGASINALHYQDEVAGGPKTIGMGTPLHTAAYFGNDEVVRYLLQRGTDRSVRGRHGRAIDVAINKGHTTIIKVLQ
jgi:ankyrin repeat protein